jgi:hypothetical protein
MSIRVVMDGILRRLDSMEHGAWIIEHGAWSMDHRAWSTELHSLCVELYINMG